MYIPKIYRGTNRDEVVALMRAYPFATLTARCGDRLRSAHLPFVVKETEGGELVLRGHLANDNEVIEHITREEILVHFHGPQSYISPSWYSHQGHYPTWIYAAVHVAGRARVLDSGELQAQLLELIEQQERAEARDSSWHIGIMPEQLTQHLKKLITGFEIQVVQMEGCFRLNQNKPRADIEAMARNLASRDCRQSRALAGMLLKHAAEVDQEVLRSHAEKYRPT